MGVTVRSFSGPHQLIVGFGYGIPYPDGGLNYESSAPVDLSLGGRRIISCSTTRRST